MIAASHLVIASASGSMPAPLRSVSSFIGRKVLRRIPQFFFRREAR